MKAGNQQVSDDLRRVPMTGAQHACRQSDMPVGYEETAR
jgi:hypothetical protein